MNLKELANFKLHDAVFFHDQLNPVIFLGDKMRPEVRNQLILIAEDFIDHLGIPHLEIEDVTLSGSNAAYSYTKHSDIDLHILVDFSKIDPNKELVKKYVDSLKNKWNQEHDINIGSHPVEVYIQDINDVNRSQAVYSVLKNKWVKKPSYENVEIDKESIKKKYDQYVKLIDSAIQQNDLELMKSIIKRLYDMRETGLSSVGEYSTENLVFKLLRSTGYISKLRKNVKSIYDANLNKV